MRYLAISLLLVLSCGAAEKKVGYWPEIPAFDMYSTSFHPKDENGHFLDCDNEQFTYGTETMQLRMNNLVLHPSVPNLVSEASRRAGADPVIADQYIHNENWEWSRRLVSQNGEVSITLPMLRCHDIELKAQDLDGRQWRLYVHSNREEVVCERPNAPAPLDEVAYCH